MTASSDVVTRFAPSPTGHLHIGGVRTALFCWAYARRHGGRFILRIEDTDQARSSEESARGILEDLAWCGVHWDEGPEFEFEVADGHLGAMRRLSLGGDPRGVGPFYQARRLEIYNAHIQRLIEIDKAYPAFDRSDELEAKRKAAVARKETYRYDRAALGMGREERMARMKAGEPHVVRFLMPDEPLRVIDEVLGEVRYAAGELDDFVLRKADGFPTYHFAVVVDDELMGVTHIMRGQEHLNNTPRHVALQRAFGFRTPTYAHMPLIFNMDGTKMSKRDKAKIARAAAKARMEREKLTAAAVATATGMDASTVQEFLDRKTDDVGIAERMATWTATSLPEIEVEDFRRAGYLPETITNFMALLGWSPGMKDAAGKDVEKFDRSFLVEHFGIDRVGRTNAKFDRVKLLSFNGERLSTLSDEQFAELWVKWAARYAPALPARFGVRAGEPLPERFVWLVRAVKPRCKAFAEASGPVRFALIGDDQIVFDEAAAKKHLMGPDGAPGAGVSVLRAMRPILAAVDPFEPAAINAAVDAAAKELSVGMGAIAQPLRIALTGSAVSPGLGETMGVLGRAAVLERIDRCLARYGSV